MYQGTDSADPFELASHFPMAHVLKGLQSAGVRTPSLLISLKVF